MRITALLAIAIVIVMVSVAQGTDDKQSDLKEIELQETLSRYGFTDETLSEQPKPVALGVAECSAEHLLCQGDRCVAQLDECISLAAAHKERPARALSSVERPTLKYEPRTTR